MLSLLLKNAWQSQKSRLGIPVCLRVSMCLFFGLIVSDFSVWGQQAEAQNPEYSVKAAILLNFAKYTSFENLGSEVNLIVVGVAGEESHYRSFQYVLEGRSVHGRSISVVWLEDPEGLGECHMAFLSRSVSRRKIWREALSKSPAMMVGEEARFLNAGGDFTILLSGEGRLYYRIKLQEERPFQFGEPLLATADRIVE